jgi:hypothetical protein
MTNVNKSQAYAQTWEKYNDKHPVLLGIKQYLGKKNDKKGGAKIFVKKEDKLAEFLMILNTLGEEKTVIDVFKNFNPNNQDTNISKAIKEKLIELLEAKVTLTDKEIKKIGKNSKNKKGKENKTGYINALMTKLKAKDPDFKGKLEAVKNNSSEKNPLEALADAENKENIDPNSKKQKAEDDLNGAIEIEKARRDFEKRKSEFEALKEKNQVDALVDSINRESNLTNMALNVVKSFTQSTQDIAKAMAETRGSVMAQLNQATQQASQQAEQQRRMQQQQALQQSAYPQQNGQY